MSITEYLINRLCLYNNILNTENKDIFLDNLDNVQNLQINNNKNALRILFENKFIKKLCNEFQFDDLDILIAGSTALASVYKHSNFKPNDLDLYIKNINKEKLIKIQNIIKNIFPKCEIIVIRSVITITWIIYKNNEIIFQIQINILQIQSWSEIFITVHSDLLCIGYDILKNQFLFLKDRWINITKNQTHYFCNILNCDSKTSLNKATKKYIKRGFICKAIHVDENNQSINFKNNFDNNNSFNVSDTDEDLMNQKEKNVLRYLCAKYYGIENIFYAKSVNDIFPDNDLPLAIYMWKLNTIYDFIKIPSTIRINCTDNDCEYCDQVCPIEIEHHNIFVKNKNCKHKISLRSYIYNVNILNCPLCRKWFNPELFIY